MTNLLLPRLDGPSCISLSSHVIVLPRREHRIDRRATAAGVPRSEYTYVRVWHALNVAHLLAINRAGNWKLIDISCLNQSLMEPIGQSSILHLMFLIHDSSALDMNNSCTIKRPFYPSIARAFYDCGRRAAKHFL